MTDRQISYEGIGPPPWKGRKYKRVSCKNYDAVLKEIGINIIHRKLLEKFTPSIQLIKQQDEYIWRVHSPIMSYDIAFKRDQEFIENVPFGNKVKTVMTFETDNFSRLVHKQMGQPPVLIVNEFTESDLIQTITVNGVAAKQFYKVV